MQGKLLPQFYILWSFMDSKIPGSRLAPSIICSLSKNSFVPKLHNYSATTSWAI